MSAQNPGISITQMAVNGPNVLMCSHPSWHPAYLGPHPCSVTGPVMTTASLATFCTEKVRMSPPAVYSGPFCLLRRCPQSSGHLGTHPNMPVCVFVSFRPYIVLEFPPVSSLYCVRHGLRNQLVLSYLPFLPSQGSNSHVVCSPQATSPCQHQP